MSIWCTLFGGSVTGWCNMITYRVFLIQEHTPTQRISFDCCLPRQVPQKKNIHKWWLFWPVSTQPLRWNGTQTRPSPPFVGGVKKVAKKTELCVQVSKMEALFLSGFDLWVLWWYFTNWSFDWIYNTPSWITNYHYKKVNAPSQIACFTKEFVGTTCWIVDISLSSSPIENQCDFTWWKPH